MWCYNTANWTLLPELLFQQSQHWHYLFFFFFFSHSVFGKPWPWFQAIAVSNYLWRVLMLPLDSLFWLFAACFLHCPWKGKYWGLSFWAEKQETAQPKASIHALCGKHFTTEAPDPFSPCFLPICHHKICSVSLCLLIDSEQYALEHPASSVLPWLGLLQWLCPSWSKHCSLPSEGNRAIAVCLISLKRITLAWKCISQYKNTPYIQSYMFPLGKHAYYQCLSTISYGQLMKDCL